MPGRSSTPAPPPAGTRPSSSATSCRSGPSATPRGQAAVARPAQARVRARLADLAHLPRRRARLAHLQRARRVAARPGPRGRARDGSAAVCRVGCAAAALLLGVRAGVQRGPELRRGAGQGGRPEGLRLRRRCRREDPAATARKPVALTGTTLDGRRGRRTTRPARSSSSTSGARGARRASPRRPTCRRLERAAADKPVDFMGIDYRENPDRVGDRREAGA